MGTYTDATIAAWQEEAGIKPATGKYAELLEKLSHAAFEAIKVIELEKSGIRDGDGYWHGSDVIGEMMDNLVWACGYLHHEAKYGGQETIEIKLVETNTITRWPCTTCCGHTEKVAILAEGRDSR
jgi:hypothetical protein